MTHEQFNAMRNLIQAMINEVMAKDSSDGGLVETIQRMELEKDARELLCTDEG